MFRFQRLGKEILRRLRRADTELALEGTHALVIYAQSARPVVVAGMQPHEYLIRWLTQRVDRDQPGGMTDRGRIVAAHLEQRRQTAENVHELLPQLLALSLQPLVVQVRQQVVLIQSRRLLEC